MFPDLIDFENKVIKQHKTFALDLETTGLNPKYHDIFIVSLACGEDTWVWNYKGSCETDNARTQEHLSAFIEMLDRGMESYLEQGKAMFCAHNAPFDLSFLKAAGLKPAKPLLPIICTRAMAKFVDNNQGSVSLEACGQKYFGEGKDPIKSYMDEYKLFTKNPLGGREYMYHSVPDALIEEYARKDAALCFKLFEKLCEAEYCSPLFWVSPFNQSSFTIYDMSSRGITVDKSKKELYVMNNSEKLLNALRDYKIATGEQFVDHHARFKRIIEARWPHTLHNFEVQSKEANRKGKVSYSFSKENWEKSDLSIAKDVLFIREYSKTIAYLKDVTERVDEDGKVYANFNPTKANTRRLSCSKPNLQNIPKKHSAFARKAFVPTKGNWFYAFDYKQMEFRYALDFAGEREAIEKIEQGLDPHQETADKCGITRTEAKTTNFGILYGMGAGTLAEQLGCSLVDAKMLIRGVYDAYPDLAKAKEKLEYDVHSKGYIMAGEELKHRLYIPKYSKFKALNYFIQCGSAEVVRKAMIELGDTYNLVMQVHDELVFEMKPSVSQAVIDRIKKVMIDSSKYSMDVDVQYSDVSYGDLKAYG